MKSPIETPHPISAPPSLWHRCLAGAVILAGLVCTVGGVTINLHDRNARVAPSLPTAQESQLEFYQTFDHNMDLAKAHSQGVFIRFMDVKDDYLAQLALNTYFRAVYDLYPTPVRVGFSDVAINTPPQMMETNAIPDDIWMKNHGLDAELTVEISPPLLLHMQLRPLDGQPPIDLPTVTYSPLILPPSLRTR